MTKTKKRILSLIIVFLAVGLGVMVWMVQRDADRELISEAGTSVHADHSSERLVYQEKSYPVLRRISSLLLIGTDNFADNTDDVKKYGNYNYQFADFLAVLVFDHDKKTVTPLQINRDTICEVPWLMPSGKVGGYEVKQINYAHTYGQGREDSCENTVLTVRKLLYDAPIDRYMAFTMDAVPVMNDLVGGVRVTLTEDMPDLGKEYVKGAEIQLRGNAALRFVRTRSLEIVNANAYRMQRQQQYLAGFTEAARTAAAKNQNLAVEAFKAIDPFLCTNLTVSNISEIVEDLCEYEILPVITAEGEYTFEETHAQFHADESSLWQCVYSAFCKKA